MQNSKPLSVYLALFIFVGAASAHELGSTGKTRHWNPARAAYMPRDPLSRKLDPRRDIAAPEFVVVLPNRWAVGQHLRICFFGGSAALRGRIITDAREWLKYANLKFDTGGPNGRDCQARDESEIRIGFSEPGLWSYIGTQSIDRRLINNSLSSLNLAGFDSNPPSEPRFTGIVLHEFGHALGFHHEHQSPSQGCDKEYDWPKLYAYYKQNYGWDQTKVDDNVRELQADRRAYDWSAPDLKSIMLYASDKQFLKKGIASPCFFAENDTLSPTDEQGALKTYPFASAEAVLTAHATQLEFMVKHSSGDIQHALSTQLDLTQQQLKAVH